MMNKLYHLFHVSSYKGGELHSDINLTLKGVACEILDYCQWDNYFAKYIFENSNLSEESFSKLSKKELIDYISDEDLRNFASDILYPGNMYAFDSHSDYVCYTSDNTGKLIEIDPTKEPGFCDILRELYKKWYNEEE